MPQKYETTDVESYVKAVSSMEGDESSVSPSSSEAGDLSLLGGVFKDEDAREGVFSNDAVLELCETLPPSASLLAVDTIAGRIQLTLAGQESSHCSPGDVYSSSFLVTVIGFQDISLCPGIRSSHSAHPFHLAFNPVRRNKGVEEERRRFVDKLDIMRLERVCKAWPSSHNKNKDAWSFLGLLAEQVARDKAKQEGLHFKTSRCRGATDATSCIYAGATACDTLDEGCDTYGSASQLGRLVTYLTRRLGGLRRYCLVCDRSMTDPRLLPHIPFVCHRDLCVCVYEGLIHADDASPLVVDTWPHQVDLFVSLAHIAASSHRCVDTFGSVPTLIDKCTGNKRSDARHPDWESIRRALAAVPSQGKTLQDPHSADDNSNDNNNGRHLLPSLSLPLVRWILSSSRCQATLMPSNARVDCFDTHLQYSLHHCHDPSFFHKRKAEGSFFAWHGSPAENWHLILRVGLKVMTGKVGKMVHGGKHGHGVYLASESDGCWKFARTDTKEVRAGMRSKKEQSVARGHADSVDRMIVIALCEVAGNEVHHVSPDPGTFLVKDPSRIALRLLFVFPSDSKPKSLKASSLSGLVRQTFVTQGN